MMNKVRNEKDSFNIFRENDHPHQGRKIRSTSSDKVQPDLSLNSLETENEDSVQDTIKVYISISADFTKKKTVLKLKQQKKDTYKEQGVFLRGGGKLMKL